MKKILYISYDGMTDPLGQSQVIPYVKGLSKYGYQFTILSFEKKDKFQQLGASIEKSLSDAGIKWVPLNFTTRPPVLAKMYDVHQMRSTAIRLQKENKFDMVHCRSYIAANVGMELKKKFGVRFFFDMRGFWADEKKDAGAWNQKNPLFRKIYSYYKKKEAQYLQAADQVISLTEAGRKEMRNWPAWNEHVKIEVIPCCTDLDLFSLTNETQKRDSRGLLQLPPGELVFSYLGSVGSWYMLDEMLTLFALALKKYPKAMFLFITNSPEEMILNRLETHGVPVAQVKIIRATRDQVPAFTKASDINISFIKPVYSKLSSSPTKLGEVLAMGIPVITNAGVGDVEEQVKFTNGGVILQHFKVDELQRAVDAIPELLHKNAASIRSGATELFDLEKGVEKYRSLYEKLLS